jgi:glycosyltransferase involved in cell wall biosynthesis
LVTGPAASLDGLRILVLADAASIHTEKWIAGLARLGGVELSLFTLNPATARPALHSLPALKRIDLFSAGPVHEAGGNWHYLLSVPRIVRAVRQVRPDCILAIYLSSYGFVGALVKGRAALAHVLIGSDVMVAPERGRVYRTLTRVALGRGDLFVSASQAITARLATLADVDPNAVLTQQYGLEEWVIGYPQATKAYGFVSNRAWVDNSRIPELLRVFRRVRTDLDLVLVGSGGPAEPEIRRLVESDPRVQALGVLRHEDNLDVVSRSAFYISMTASDGASLSLMEAMALGAIPVVSDIEANREWIHDGVNGVLLPLGDESEAAERVQHLLSRAHGELDDMRARNRAIIGERGSMTHNMARFRARLISVVGRKRRKS